MDKRLLAVCVLVGIVFVVLCFDVYRTSRLMRISPPSLEKAESVPLPYYMRVFKVFVQQCTFDGVNKSLELSTFSDPRSLELAQQVGVLGATRCIIDNYIFEIRTKSQSSHTITFVLYPLKDAPLCFTQLTAYDSVHELAPLLSGTTVFMTTFAV